MLGCHQIFLVLKGAVKLKRLKNTALELLYDCFDRYDGSNDLASGECYNPMSNNWSFITPMGTRRSCLGIAGYDGLVS